MRKITDKQARVLAFVKKRIAADGASPTMREIAEHMGLSGRSSVSVHLDGLETKGFIRRSKGVAHGIEVL